MTETRWTRIGTFTTQVEADECLEVLVEAQIPYSQSGMLGPHRTGSIEFHVPNDFVEAAKTAFAQARARPRPAHGPTGTANAREAAEQSELDAGIARDRSRRRNFARVSLAVLAILCVALGLAAVSNPERGWTPGVVLLVFGGVLLVPLALSLRRRGTA